MIEQVDHVAWHKLNAVIRKMLLYYLPLFKQSIVINEYPKSGGTWLTKLLSDILGLPFAKNRLPYIKNQMFHCHMLAKGLNKKQIILWRDGRDILISQYYHSLFYNDVGNKVLVDYTRSKVPFQNYMDVSDNLADFIRFIDSGKAKPKYTWSDFVTQWSDDEHCFHVKYENLYDMPIESLVDVLNFCGFYSSQNDILKIKNTVSKYALSPKNEQKEVRSIEQKVPFARKGGYGGWKKYFKIDAAKLFCELHGDSLIKLGYETDYSWIKSIDD